MRWSSRNSTNTRTLDGELEPWTLQNTAGVLVLLVWGVGLLAVAFVVLRSSWPFGPPMIIGVDAFAAGLAGLYLGVGVIVLRAIEVIKHRRHIGDSNREGSARHRRRAS